MALQVSARASVCVRVHPSAPVLRSSPRGDRQVRLFTKTLLMQRGRERRLGQEVTACSGERVRVRQRPGSQAWSVSVVGGRVYSDPGTLSD